jgi:capsular exopolysaccharide synthesis family protein
MINKEEESFEIHEMDFNMREQLDKYLFRWKWFLVGIFSCLIIAFLYMRYAVPNYKATATILVRDERKGGLASEMTAFADLDLLGGIKNNVDNEIEIIKSRTILERAIQKLNFNVDYYSKGHVRSFEMYRNKPFEISFFDKDAEFYNKKLSFVVNSVSEKQFQLTSADGTDYGKFHYGNVIDLAHCKIIVSPTPQKGTQKNAPYSVIVEVHKLEVVVQDYKKRINVTGISKTSSVVELTLNDPVKRKAEDLLNAIIAIYNQDAIDDKTQISISTENFVIKRLDILSKELGHVEKDASNFKTANQITDLTADAGIFLQNSADFQKALLETETQVRIVGEMIAYMDTGKNELVPSNIVPNDITSTELIAEHNRLVLERDRILKSGTEENAVIVSINNKIEELRGNIRETLVRLNASLKIRQSDLEKQVGVITNKISRMPDQEREYRGIARQQNIKEALYIYLLQKREEAALSVAATAPNAKVIDAAMSPPLPVSPQGKIIYLGALFLGLLIPFVAIYLIDILDTKVQGRQDIEGKVKAPFLGDIPKSLSKDEVIHTNSRSSAAEAIRIIRTNLEFMLANVPENQCKTIFVTSTLPKEGKTFIAVNLAATIALSKKKVLLIGLDVRNPKLDQYLHLPQRGVTNYLSQAGTPVDDFIVKLDLAENFYVLPSGVVPPNPVELLMNDKINKMFADLKKEYDYIIVDTAPVGVVTDTLLVAKNADSFIYVVRANYLDKRLLKIADTFYRENKLPNMALLLNDTDVKKGYGYGYGYGYGQEEEKKSLLSRLFGKSKTKR